MQTSGVRFQGIFDASLLQLKLILLVVASPFTGFSCVLYRYCEACFTVDASRVAYLQKQDNNGFHIGAAAAVFFAACIKRRWQNIFTLGLYQGLCRRQ